MEDIKKVIKDRFKPSFVGIIKNSNGYKKLFLTRYNLFAVLITSLILFLYFFTDGNSFDLIMNLNSVAISLLGGIVGLSLAGLTMIITFSNQELIDYSSLQQAKKFKSSIQEAEKFNTGVKLEPSYFQLAIAKFSFIVFFQVLTLLFFIVSAIIANFKIKVIESLAYWINTFVFSISVYLLVFSLVLVLASILNLFTFSQTANSMNFVKKMQQKETNSGDEEEN